MKNEEYLVDMSKIKESPLHWTEDFTHENGNYQGRCQKCNSMFLGHKRRIICKLCSLYYTPSIEEFSIGFAYEIKIHNIEANTKKWIKDSVYFHERLKPLYTTHDLHRFIKSGNLRVKYLDEQDIESLGFIFKSKSIDNWYILNPKTFECGNLKFRHITLQHGHSDNTLKLYGHEYSHDKPTNEERLFSGYCKNKSELIKLLKQIGYEKE